MTEPMFRGPLWPLSNFYTDPFYLPELDAVVASAEHGFNALKTSYPREQRQVLAAATPKAAKAAGRAVTLRPGWDTGARVWAMRRVLGGKFTVPATAQVLLGTGDLRLVETNTWHDQFWGDCLCPRHAPVPGANMLGELLMDLRHTMRLNRP